MLAIRVENGPGARADVTNEANAFKPTLYGSRQRQTRWTYFLIGVFKTSGLAMNFVDKEYRISMRLWRQPDSRINQVDSDKKYQYLITLF